MKKLVIAVAVVISLISFTSAVSAADATMGGKSIVIQPQSDATMGGK